MDGNVGSFSVGGTEETVSLEQLTFEGRQQPTKHGLMVGELAVEMTGLSVAAGGINSGSVETMSINARSELDGDDFNAVAAMSSVVRSVPEIGEVELDVVFNMAGADAAALGRVQQALESAGANPDPMSAFGQMERDVQELFASGFTFNFERLNITLPSGTIAASMLFEFAEEDPATFDWSTLLLSTNASIDLSIADPVVQILVQTEPNMAMAIGGGYLVKRGDVYELEARLKKGLLTVNGAPIPIPLGQVR